MNQFHEQITADQVARELATRRKLRAQRWEDIGERIGRDYSSCKLSRWVHHGGADEQQSQCQTIGKLRSYLECMAANVEAGTNLVLLGPMGTGKDFMLSAAMRCAVLSWGLDVEWRNGTSLYAEFRQAMSLASEVSEWQLHRTLIEARILAISDPLPPVGGLTEFQAATLFTIIDGRYRARRPTWLTMNVVNRAEAQSRMGAQLVDRLAHRAVSLFCNWGSYREFERQGAAK